MLFEIQFYCPIFRSILKMKTASALLLLLFIAFYSCQKEPDTTPTAATSQNEEKVEEYETEPNFRLGPIIMFTKNNEITDTNFIKKYLQNHSTFARNDTFFHLSTLHPATSIYKVKMSSLGKDSIRHKWTGVVGVPSPFTPYKPFEIMSKSDTQLLIKTSDSTGFGYLSNPLSHSDTIYQKLYKLLPTEVVCGKKGDPPFERYVCLGRQIIPVNIRNEELYIQLLTFLHVDLNQPQGGSFIRLIFDNTNLFDPKVRSYMYANDTIVYQSKELKLIKQ